MTFTCFELSGCWVCVYGSIDAYTNEYIYRSISFHYIVSNHSKW